MSVRAIVAVAAGYKLRGDYLRRTLLYINFLLFVWLAWVIYRFTPYYSGYLDSRTQNALLYLAIAYSLGGLFFYSLASLSKINQSKSFLVAKALKRICLGLYTFLSSGPRDYAHKLAVLSKRARVALLFGLVKLFFIPLMVSFLFGNYDSLKTSFENHGAGLLSVQGFNYVVYPALFALFLTVDTAFFAFGYLFEADFLNNRLRSVDPTALGWVVALICYPPFNTLTTNYLNWPANDAPSALSQWLTFVLRLAVVVLMGFYASASVALGPKASNLTNRGIVGYGPYKYVRHPAYITKNLAWWVSMLPALTIAGILSMSFWSAIYFMRAITEERHLSADPDYLAYCEKTPYRFIPKVF